MLRGWRLAPRSSSIYARFSSVITAALSGIGRRDHCSENSKSSMTLCCSAFMVLLSAVAVPVWAQTSVDDRPHRLVFDPSLMATMPQPHVLAGTPLKPATEAPSGFDVRPLVETLTSALTGTPHMRAADATAGMVLIAFGTRARHPMSAAVFVGVHAVQLGLRRKGPSAWNSFEIQPDVGRGRFAITVRRAMGESR